MSGLVRTLILDRTGTPLAEVKPAWEYLAWRLSNTAQGAFWMRMDDPLCTQAMLRMGNRVYVEFDNGLPAWGGVIDVPRKRQAGLVRVSCYTGERLLDWRRTAKSRTFGQQPAGYIFRTLIEEENWETATGVTVAQVYTGGVGRSTEYHYHDLLARIIDLCRLSGYDFAVLPALGDDNRLTFSAYWYQRRGADKTGSVWLLDGRNVKDPVLDEQGPVANRVILVGDGTTWGEDRPVSIRENTTSRNLYGYREYAEVQTGVVNQETLDANADALLDRMSRPTNIVTLSALDQEPGKFSAYGIGDIVQAELFTDHPEWTYSGPVRIIAREWRPSNECRLEVEEWEAAS
jgi:hypothetical protein